MADICSTLQQANIDVEYPLSLTYNYDLTQYWSAACSDLRPTCIAAPSSAAEMSQIITELHKVETLFAVKSGGHNPNNGWASIEDGLLISTKNLNQVDYNKEEQTAVIGPGLSWEEAQAGLDGTGQAVVGGRLGGVGIGGYMLGCMLFSWAVGSVFRLTKIRWNELLEHPVRLGRQQCGQLRSGSGQRYYREC
jgi:FAD/FMN-containing dehydrogenase